MQSLNTIAKGAGFVFIGMIISKFLTYLYRVIIARLGTTEYGIVSLALAILGMTSILSLLGLHIGVIRFTAFYKAQKKISYAKGVLLTSIKLSLTVSIVIMILLLFSAEWISTNIFSIPQLKLYLQIFAFMIPLMSVRDLIMAAVRASTERSDYDVVSRNIIENILKVGSCLIFIAMGYAILGAVLAVSIGIIVTFFLALWYYRLLQYKNIVSKESSKEIISFSLPLLFTSLLIQVLLWTDVVMLGFYKSASEVGIYNAALPTATLMSVIPGGIIALFLPIITKLIATNDTKDFSQTLKTCTKWIWYFNVPIFFVLFFFSSPLLKHIFGNDYTSGSIPLMIISFSYLLYQTSQPSAETLNALKKSNLVFFNTLTVACLNIGLNYTLIPSFGMIGGSIATGVSFILYGFLSWIEAFYFTKITVLQFSYIKAIIAASISYIAILLFKITSATLFGFLMSICLFFIFYCFLVVIIGSLDSIDKEVLTSIKNKIW